MPTRIPRYKPPRVKAKQVERRPNANARGYCSKAHKRWREAVLLRDNFECRVCGRVCGSPREAHADHVVPIVEGGERYSLDNGQTLCQRCHAIKTTRENAREAGRFAARPADSSPEREGAPSGGGY